MCFQIMVPTKMDVSDIAWRAGADAELVAVIVFQIIHRMAEQNSSWVSLPVNRKKGKRDVLTELESMKIIESKKLHNAYFAEGRWYRRQDTTFYRLNPVYKPDQLTDYTLTNQGLINSLIKFARLHKKQI